MARDRFADVIMDYVGPLGIGITGWVIDRNEAVLANDAHLDPRSIQIPGTPEEPESMIVVPLGVGGEVIGTLNIGRMGHDESHFDANEFELTKLFAGTGVDRPPERGDTPARSRSAPSSTRSPACATTAHSSASSARPSRPTTARAWRC